QRGDAARNFAAPRARRGRPGKGETRPGEHPLGIAAASVVVRGEPVPHALPAVILFHLHPWPSRLAGGSRRPLERGVSLEPGVALLVPLFRAPATAHGRLGGCDLFYADPHSLRLALCLRRRAGPTVRDLLGLGGSRMDGVFQAAPLLGLLRMLVRAGLLRASDIFSVSPP